MGDLIRPVLEGAIGDRFVLAGHGNRPRCLSGLTLEILGHETQRRRRRRRGAQAKHHLDFLGTQERDGGDRRLDQRAEDTEQPLQALRMLLQNGFRIDRRVGIEVDLHGLVFAPVEDKKGQIFDGSVGNVLNPRGRTAHAQIVVEGFDVDDGGKQMPPRP